MGNNNHSAVKSYEELTFSDDFMFCKVLQYNPALCKELLELVLGKPVGEIVQIDQQHVIRVTPGGRGVRFDVCAKDDRSVVYDIEMQNARKDDIAKRARYAQCMMDQELLGKGTKYKIGRASCRERV